MSRRSDPHDSSEAPDPEAAGPLTPNEKEEVEQHAHLRPLAIYEVVRQEGAEELARPAPSLWWSGVVAGLSIGLSIATEGTLHTLLPEAPWRLLVESFGYTVGFLIVILARQQLFTEVTLTAVLPVLAKPSRGGFRALLRNWGVVLAANLLGTALFAAILWIPGLLPRFLVDGALGVSRHMAELSPMQAFGRAILSGWMMALLVWLLPLAEAARIWVIVLVAYLIALFELPHVISGAVEVFLLLFHGEMTAGTALAGFLLPLLAGNVIGGSALFAMAAYGQVREEMAQG